MGVSGRLQDHSNASTIRKLMDNMPHDDKRKMAQVLKTLDHIPSEAEFNKHMESVGIKPDHSGPQPEGLAESIQVSKNKNVQ